jgi:hypothetical protein
VTLRVDKYIPPEFSKTSFHCPHCSVYAHQRWGKTMMFPAAGGKEDCAVVVSECAHCRRHAFWLDSRLIHPAVASVERAHPELPKDLVPLFDEARDVCGRSPRAAAALLRLLIQHLMRELGEGGDNLNLDISALVSKGLPVQIQQALDYCRVVGNNAVHPGEIEIDGRPERSHSLFRLVNLIVEDRIARPKAVQALFDDLPDSARDAIARRGANSKRS